MRDRHLPGPVPLSEEINSFLRRTGLGLGPRNREVFEAWSKAIGGRLAGRTAPVALREGELVVEVSSAALLQELRSFTGERLRNRTNEILGAERVRRVTYKLKT